jgi:hypothetical protein
MGIKLEGFLCDNCRIFTTFTGVASYDVDDIILNDDLSPNLIYAKIEGWKYYNVEEMSHMPGWIKWNKGNSFCLCPKCDRKIKLKEIITKLKSHD